MGIRSRIALWGALVVCATVALFGLFLYTVVRASEVPRVDQELRARYPPTTFQATAGADGVLHPLRQGGFGPIPVALPTPLTAGTRTVTVRPGDPIRVLVEPEPDGTYLVTGQHLAETDRQTRGLLTYMVVTAIAATGAGLAAIWFATGRALRPLRAMARTAADVGRTDDLGRRLPRHATRDEIGRLTDSFNEMLGRLEASRESQRRFVADASHELRTPLTSIRGNAGFLLCRPPPNPEAAAEATADIADEAERLGRLVDGLLTLARADAGHHLPMERLDLAEVVAPVARRAGLASHCEATPIAGNADALSQLVWILADNARRHGGGEATVWVVPRSEGGATLLVADGGPGIPAGEEERIFERFYRADASRSSGGAGLGLAIARWIVTHHGGSIWAANGEHGGAVFVAELS